MKIPSKIFLLVVMFLFSSPLFAQVKGKLKVQILDAGGNAQFYGLVYITGPSNRLSTLSCPHPSGENPNGETSCTTTYGSSYPEEWQAGDILRARVRTHFVTDIPLQYRPGDANNCILDFQGFSGVCSGQGTPSDSFNTYRDCEFKLPESGDISLGVSFVGKDNKDRSCPDLSALAPEKPTASPSSTPVIHPNTPDDLVVAALGNAAVELLESLKLKRLLGEVAARTILPVTPGQSLEFRATVNAIGEVGARSSLKTNSLNRVSILKQPVIAKGKIKSSTKVQKKLKLTPTRKGKRVPEGRSGLMVLVTVKAMIDGQEISSTSITGEIN